MKFVYSTQTMDPRLSNIKELIGAHPDFPKPGILFRDIFPVLRDAKIFKDLIDVMVEHVQKNCPGAAVIVGLEARGFLFGPTMAQCLGIAFVPARKKGKLPGELYSETYTLEYGTDTLEVQKNAIQPGQKVVIVDDLLATGGTLKGAVQLMEKIKADVLDCLVVIELDDLKGREKVGAHVTSLIHF